MAGRMHRIPREKLPWYPTVDIERCIGCKNCFNFCKNNVFDWDEENNIPKVVNPYNCVLGCAACANICEEAALRFPTIQEIRDLMKKLDKEME